MNGVVTMNKRIFLAKILVILLVGMSACSNSADEATITNDETQSEDESTEDTSNDDKDDEETVSTQEEVQENQTVDKVVGRKTEFLQMLDNVQKELDALPVKEEADNGITAGMSEFYGISYEMYDEALNEIYALLQNELSPEIIRELEVRQVKWIEHKENLAIQDSEEFGGGSFANVAYVSSLYESTKTRCYDLVNNYMTD